MRGGRKKRIYLVDGNSYIHRAYHAIRELRNSRGLPTNAVYGFLSMLVKVLREEKPELAAVVFDAGGTTFRHELYPSYKANRPRMPEDLAVQVDYVHRLTRAFGLPVFEQEGVEADDLLATLGRRASEAGLEIVYVTGDKDIQQLVGRGASTLDTMKERRVTLEDFRREHGFDPRAMVDYMALVGDATDNVPGVPGVGPKTAEKLIRSYGSLEALYDKLDELPEGRVKETLRSHREEAFLARRLVELKDDLPLELDWDSLGHRVPDRKLLREMLDELEFKRFLRELDLGEEGEGTGFREPGPVEEAAAWLRRFEAGRPLAFALEEVDGRLQAALTQDGQRVGFGEPGAAGGPAGEKLARILADPSVPKTGFDLKASLRRLREAGFELDGLDLDVMVAAYLLNPSEKGNTLGDLAVSWLGTSALSRGEEGPRQRRLFAGREEAAGRGALEAAAVRGLGEVLGPKLREAGLDGLYREMELPLISVLDRMEEAGIGVDLEALREMSKEMTTILDAIEEKIYTLAGTRFNIGSPKQLAEVLFVRLGLPAAKKTKTGFSTDEEVLTGLAASHELPQQLLDHRQISKLKNTYVDVLPNLVSPRDGRIHTSFNQAATATGRLSSSNPNLQNIPVRTEWGRRIRQAFVPRPGWKFISADYSQIELRVLAHLSGDPVLTEAFGKGEDIHARTAAEIFRVGPGEVTREMRRAAKVINFGIIYGMSPYGLSRELGVDQREAKRYIDEYFAVYRGVREYLDGLVAGAKRDGYVSTLFGRRRWLRELQSPKPQVAQFAERAALNTPIQGTAADLIKRAMIDLTLALAAECLQTRLLVQIHDELLLESPSKEVERASALVRKCMEGAAKFGVPIVAEVAVGDNWGVLK